MERHAAFPMEMVLACDCKGRETVEEGYFDEEWLIEDCWVHVRGGPSFPVPLSFLRWLQAQPEVQAEMKRVAKAPAI